MMMGETTKVLLVEDNPGDARLIREMLAEAGGDAFELEWVSQLSEGLERLSAGKVDLVLLDLGLPDSRGIDTFFRAYSHAPEVPFVLMTGLDDETLALTAIRQGAQDYLVKGETNAKLLLRAIRYATERKRAELALETERQKLFSVLNSLPAFVHLRGPDFMIRFANRRFTEVFGEPGARPCYEVLRGRSEPCEDCQALEVLRTKVPRKFEWTSPLNASTYEIYHYPFCVDHDLVVLTLGIDITERKQAEDQLFKKTHDLGERVKELHCLYSISRLMGMPNISRDEIIQRVLELIPPAWHYPDITCVRITLEGDTFRSVNFRETQWRQASDILVHGDCLGRVEVYYRREKPTLDEGPFLKEERHLLETIAKALGIIIERKQAEQKLRESEQNLRYLASQLLTAQESERNRISRELHDEVQQALIILKMKLSNIEKNLSPDQIGLRKDSRDLPEEIDGIIDNIRRLSRDLSPYALEDLGLSGALRHLVGEFGDLHNIECSIVMDEIDNLFDRESQICIYRIFQESLTNIAKHSSANKIEVRSQTHDAYASFQVQDNGKGFDMTKVARVARGGGLGLVAMDERVRMLGGSLEISSQEGQGTRVSFVVPIRARKVKGVRYDSI